MLPGGGCICDIGGNGGGPIPVPPVGGCGTNICGLLDKIELSKISSQLTGMVAVIDYIVYFGGSAQLHSLTLLLTHKVEDDC